MHILLYESVDEDLSVSIPGSRPDGGVILRSGLNLAIHHLHLVNKPNSVIPSQEYLLHVSCERDTANDKMLFLNESDYGGGGDFCCKDVSNYFCLNDK